MKKIVILLCVLMLSACSTRFAYNNIDWLVYWYLDDYVELNTEQEEQFDSMLAKWMQWHKTQELPKYKQQLQDIINEVEQGQLNHSKFVAHRERARSHWERARNYVAQDIVTIAKTLDKEQVEYFFNALEKQNKEEEEEILENQARSAEKRRERWIKRNQKSVKGWIGKLQPEQNELIESFRERFESTGALWLEYRRKYQSALKTVFDFPERGAQFEAALLELITNPEQYRSEAFNQITQSNIEASSEYFLGLLALSSNKQKEKLVDEINELIEDIEYLAK